MRLKSSRLSVQRPSRRFSLCKPCLVTSCDKYRGSAHTHRVCVLRKALYVKTCMRVEADRPESLVTQHTTQKKWFGKTAAGGHLEVRWLDAGTPN